MSKILQPAPPKQRAARARIAISFVFFAHALVLAACVSRISYLKHSLGLSDAQLGLALLAGPICSVAAIFAAGQLIKRIGSGRSLRRAVPLMCAAAPLPGFANSQWSLALFLGIWGSAEGIVGVAMNAQAVDVESRTARPIMSRLHGIWSLGALAGGVAGALAGYFERPVALQGAVLGLAAFIGFAALKPHLITTSGRETSTPPGDDGAGRRRKRIGAAMVLLSAVAFCSNLVEGSTQTWSSVFFAESAKAPENLAGVGLPVYAVSVFASRLFVDRLLAGFGTVRAVRTLLAIAAVGFVPALVAPNPGTAILALAAVGLGFSPVIPAALRASSKVSGISPGPAMAVVSGAMWGAVMCGPPLIGALAALSGVASALGLIIAFAVVAIMWCGPVLRIGGIENLRGGPDDPETR